MNSFFKLAIASILALGLLTGCSSGGDDSTDTSENTSIFDTKGYDRIGGLYSKYNKDAKTYELYTRDGERVGRYFTELVPSGDRLLAVYGTRNPAIGVFPNELYSVGTDGSVETLSCDKVYLLGGFGAVIYDDGMAKVVGSDLKVIGEIGISGSAFYGGTLYPEGRYGGPAGYYLEQNGDYTVVTEDGKLIPGSEFIIDKFGNHLYVVKTDGGYAVYKRDADTPSDVGKEYHVMYAIDTDGEVQKYQYLVGNGRYARMHQQSEGVYHYSGMDENRFDRMTFMGEYVILNNRVCTGSLSTLGTVSSDAKFAYEPSAGGIGSLTVTDENGTHFFSYVEGEPKAPADAMDVIHGEGEFVYLTLGMGGLTCRRVRSIDQSDSGTYVCETETVLKPYIEEMGGKMRFVNKELYLYDSYAWLMDDGELLLSGYGRFVGSDDAILYVPFAAGQNMILYDGDQRVVFDDITSYTRTGDDRLLLLRAKNALTLVDADGALMELMTFDEGVPVPNSGFMVRVGEKVLYVNTDGKVVVTLDGWYEGLILERVESGDSLEGGMVFVDHDDKNKEGYPKKVIFHYDSQTGRFTVDERYAPLMTDMDSCCVPNEIP